MSTNTLRIRAFLCVGKNKMQQYSLWRHLIKLTKDVLFDFQIFHNGLQHEVRTLCCRCRVCGGRHVLQDRLDEFFTCLKNAGASLVLYIHTILVWRFTHSYLWFISKLFLHYSFQATFNSFNSFFKDVVIRVHQCHRVSSGSSNLSNADIDYVKTATPSGKVL